MTYSLDFRKKALEIRRKEGLSFAQTAKRFGVNVNSLFLWSKNLEPTCNKNRPSIKIDQEVLLQDIKNYPDAYNYERAKCLNVSTSGVYCALKRMGMSYKKNSESPQSLQRKKRSLPKKNINEKVTQLSILMKVGFLMICLELMVILKEGNVALEPMTGEQKEERMQ